MSTFSNPTFVQGAPLDVTELNKLSENILKAYKSANKLTSSTTIGQTESYIAKTYASFTNVQVGKNGYGSTKVDFGQSFTRQPVVVATIGIPLNDKSPRYTVSVVVNSTNDATIHVRTAEDNERLVRVNFVAVSNEPVIEVE